MGRDVRLRSAGRGGGNSAFGVDSSGGVCAWYAADGMELHPTKTKIVRLKDGFRFLGFIYRLTPAGKVVMTVDPQNVKAERKRLFRLAQLIKAGEKPASALYEQYGSWKAHAAKGNSKKLLQRMDQYVKSLLEGITT